MSIYSKRQEESLAKIEEALSKAVPDDNPLYSTLTEAMNYSLLAGGKRIRPMLMLEFCSLCGGNRDDIMSFACALEMIHTYSLIHDDLPCMDNDDLRRGKPTNHVVYGESNAMLAGDALLTYAFEHSLKPSKISPDKAVKAVYTLAKCAGISGMVGGQFIDLDSEDKKISIDVLEQMHNKKTGALMVAACTMGCILAGADEGKINAAETFAQKLGLAFQVEDDILDVTSTTEELGKPTGSDSENKKSTYVTELGIEKARIYAEELTNEAIVALDIFDDCEVKSDLIKLSLSLVSRNA